MTDTIESLFPIQEKDVADCSASFVNVLKATYDVESLGSAASFTKAVLRAGKGVI